MAIYCHHMAIFSLNLLFLQTRKVQVLRNLLCQMFVQWSSMLLYIAYLGCRVLDLMSMTDQAIS
jgi:hypothetical protein